jgi:hypothetical protein
VTPDFAGAQSGLLAEVRGRKAYPSSATSASSLRIWFVMPQPSRGRRRFARLCAGYQRLNESAQEDGMSIRVSTCVLAQRDSVQFYPAGGESVTLLQNLFRAHKSRRCNSVRYSIQTMQDNFDFAAQFVPKIVRFRKRVSDRRFPILHEPHLERFWRNKTLLSRRATRRSTF